MSENNSSLEARIAVLEQKVRYQRRLIEFAGVLFVVSIGLAIGSYFLAVHTVERDFERAAQDFTRVFTKEMQDLTRDLKARTR